MANSYTAGTKVFNIDTDTNVAGLTALKGSASANNDMIYISEGARLTIDAGLTCLYIYVGDNATLTAASKVGHWEVSAGVTLTLAQTAGSGGMTGLATSTDSTITLSGTGDAARAKVLGTGITYVSNQNIPAIKISATWGHFSTMVGVYTGTAHSFANTLFDNCSNALYITAVQGQVLPESLDGCEFRDCTNAINETTASVMWDDFFAVNNVKFTTTNAAKTNGWVRYFGNTVATRYVKHVESASALSAPPVWDTTTGVQSLTYNVAGFLTALWGAATASSGVARFRVYIREGAAPDDFGTDSPYFLCETIVQSAIIACDAGGAPLAAGDTYHVVVRTADVLLNEDTNTTALQVTIPASTIDSRLDALAGLCNLILVNTL